MACTYVHVLGHMNLPDTNMIMIMCAPDARSKLEAVSAHLLILPHELISAQQSTQGGLVGSCLSVP
eukprot:1146916-Pelagomonas_calceolata.AAC.3